MEEPGPFSRAFPVFGDIWGQLDIYFILVDPSGNNIDRRMVTSEDRAFLIMGVARTLSSNTDAVQQNRNER